MKSTTTLLHAILGFSFIVALAIGLAFWSGRLLDLLRLHMALGALFAATLIALAAVGAFRGVPLWRGAVLTAFGLAVVALGVTQSRLLPGSWHWLVRLLHLGLGIAAAMQGFALARVLRAEPAAAGADDPGRGGKSVGEH